MPPFFSVLFKYFARIFEAFSSFPCFIVSEERLSYVQKLHAINPQYHPRAICLDCWWSVCSVGFCSIAVFSRYHSTVLLYNEFIAAVKLVWNGARSSNMQTSLPLNLYLEAKGVLFYRRRSRKEMRTIFRMDCSMVWIS